MTMFLPSHLAAIRAKLGRVAEIGAGVALYGGFIVFMGFAVGVVMPFVVCDALIEGTRKMVG